MTKRHTHQVLITFSFILFLLSCAEERPLKPVLSNPYRLPKSAFQNQRFYFLKSISHVEYPGKGPGKTLATGMYLEQDRIVRAELTEDRLHFVSEEPIYDPSSGLELSRQLASFKIRHVDVLRKQNENGEDTHEEEVTETRREWSSRDYLEIDITNDSISDQLTSNVLTVSPVELSKNSITHVQNIRVKKLLSDQTGVEITYSLKPYEPNLDYAPRHYPKFLERKFGVFTNDRYSYDENGRLTQSALTRQMKRWDLKKPILFKLSPDFPAHLKEKAKQVFSNWDAVLQKIVGHPVLTLSELTTPPSIGDLSYNLVHFVSSPSRSNLLGYGPSFSDPRTGEILKADVFLYGDTLKTVLYQERSLNSLIAAATSESALEALPLLSINDWVSGYPSGFTLPVLADAIGQNGGPEIFDNLLTETHALLAKETTESHVSALECMTFLTPQSAALTENLGPISKEDLELQVFAPLLAHETGHTLGLRHNLKGSADIHHFEEGFHSSSVMDYLPSQNTSPIGPGPYDRAALEVIYGSELNLSQLLSKNFYYCSDSGVMSSKDPFCSHYDTGTNYLEILADTLKRYELSYLFHNLRQDSAFFNPASSEYTKSVLQGLRPVRHIFDHATAVVDRAESFLNSTSQAKQLQILKELWELLREQIELSPNDKANAPANSIVSLPREGNPPLEIDLRKLDAIYHNASIAKTVATGGLSAIVLGKPKVPGSTVERPDLDVEDSETEELTVRGILPDKLIALELLTRTTADPLTGNVAKGPFERQTKLVSDLLSTLLSSISLSKGNFAFNPVQPTLRESAYYLVDKILTKQSGLSNQASELLKLNQVRSDDPDTAKINRLKEIQQKRISILIDLNTKDITKEERDKMGEELTNLEREREEMNLATIEVGDGLFLKAPLVLKTPDSDLNIATGRLIRYNIEHFLELKEVLEAMTKELRIQIQTERDPETRTTLLKELNLRSKMASTIPALVQTEKRLLLRFYHSYTLQ